MTVAWSITALVAVAVLLGTNTPVGATTIGPPVVYGGHTYYLLDHQNWFDAEAEAIALGGHLVAINNVAENEFILNTFTDEHIWIGFTDRDLEGTFVWTNGDPVTYTNWRSREPNDLFGEDYGHMHGASHQDRGTWNDLDGTWLLYGVAEIAATMVIDIKPGSFPNSINLKAKGVIPVAIITTSIADGDPFDFDATQVDSTTALFGPSGASIAHPVGHIEDVDGDGDFDLLLHFNIQDTGIACGDTSASLTAETFGGDSIEGEDSIVTVGCK